MKFKDVAISVMGLGSIVGIGFGLTNPVILVCALIGGAITIICGCALMEPRQRRVAQAVERVETINSGSVEVVASGKGVKKPPAILAYMFERVKGQPSSQKISVITEEPEERPGIDKPGVYMTSYKWTRAFR